MLAPVERLIALRYLGARRKEGFISVIAGFPLLGIWRRRCDADHRALRHERRFAQEVLTACSASTAIRLLTAAGRNLDDFDNTAAEVAKVRGVVTVYPTVDGAVHGDGGTAMRSGASACHPPGGPSEDRQLRASLTAAWIQFSGKSVVAIGSSAWPSACTSRSATP